MQAFQTVSTRGEFSNPSRANVRISKLAYGEAG